MIEQKDPVIPLLAHSLKTAAFGEIIPNLDTRTDIVKFGIRFDGICRMSKDSLSMGETPFKHAMKTMLIDRMEEIRERLQAAIEELQRLEV